MMKQRTFRLLNLLEKEFVAFLTKIKFFLNRRNLQVLICPRISMTNVGKKQGVFLFLFKNTP